MRAGPEGLLVDGSGAKVVTQQAAELDALVIQAEVRRVTEAMWAADNPVVDSGKLLRAVVEPLLDDLPAVEVDGPSVQRRGLFGRAVDVAVEHLGMAGDVDDDIAAVVVGVQRVEDVAELHVEPAHVGVASVARHHTDAGAVLRLPRGGERAFPDEVEVEDDGKIEEHGVSFGDREVVHHRRARDVDVLAADELTRGVDDVVAQPRRAERVVPEEEHLAGDRVRLRVRGHRGVELAAEVVPAHGREIRAHLGREAHLDEGEDLAGVRDDVGVRHARADREHVVGLAGDGLLAEEGDGLVGPHPAVAVRGRLPAAQLDRVDHAVAREPVVRRRVGRDRVGADAQQAAAQLRREGALDREVGGGQLVLHGREVPDEVAVLDCGAHEAPPSSSGTDSLNPRVWISHVWSTSTSTSGHGKPGMEMRSDVRPWTAVHTPTAPTTGSTGRNAPASMHRCTASTRCWKARAPAPTTTSYCCASARVMKRIRYGSGFSSPNLTYARPRRRRLSTGSSADRPASSMTESKTSKCRSQTARISESLSGKWR